MGTVLNPALSSVHVMNHLKLRLATVSEKIRSKLKKDIMRLGVSKERGLNTPWLISGHPPPYKFVLKEIRKIKYYKAHLNFEVFFRDIQQFKPCNKMEQILSKE